MAEIRADLAQFYPLKALLENVLGRHSFSRVKDYAPLSTWKAEVTRLLNALELSIRATIIVVDDPWKLEALEILQHGRQGVARAKSIDELFACLSASLAELSFHQLGLVPRGHASVDSVPLTLRNWNLASVRSVQYVQTPAQKELQLKSGRRRGAI
jgi:hypothetical protein